MDTAEPLLVGEPVWQEGEVHVLPGGERFVSLDGRWLGCTLGRVARGVRALWIEAVDEPIAAGMSGSPIVSIEGTAIAVVVSSSGGPFPYLALNLPGWLLYELGSVKSEEIGAER